MQVNCPNCGEKVAAQNINIQKMTAVCTACDTVFKFELPEAKVKRRKVKPPAKLTLHDAETLQMEFWTNFRLERNENFIGSLAGGIGLLFLSGTLFWAGSVPRLLSLLMLLIASALFYLLALTVVNKTHIEMDEEAIKVTRKPIPNLLNQGYEVSLSGVTAIKYEETAISKKEGYDTPRYRVWAETVDGSRRTIVNDVTEDYAVFIAQRLEERLHTGDEMDISRLEDDGDQLDDEADMNEVVQTSRTNTQSNSGT